MAPGRQEFSSIRKRSESVLETMTRLHWVLISSLELFFTE